MRAPSFPTLSRLLRALAGAAPPAFAPLAPVLIALTLISCTTSSVPLDSDDPEGASSGSAEHDVTFTLFAEEPP